MLFCSTECLFTLQFSKKPCWSLERIHPQTVSLEVLGRGERKNEVACNEESSSGAKRTQLVPLSHPSMMLMRMHLLLVTRPGSRCTAAPYRTCQSTAWDPSLLPQRSWGHKTPAWTSVPLPASCLPQPTEEKTVKWKERGTERRREEGHNSHNCRNTKRSSPRAERSEASPASSCWGGQSPC